MYLARIPSASTADYKLEIPDEIYIFWSNVKIQL